MKKSLLERFWMSVDKRSSDNCWEWTTSKSHGYGIICEGPAGNCTRHMAHRLSWEIHNGPIPKGLGVLHKCDNPPCVNPDHLFLGTQRDNMYDMMNKGRGFVLPPRHGSNHGMSKLDERKVLAIRDSIADGKKGKDIALDYGVTPTLISYIKNRKIWAHI